MKEIISKSERDTQKVAQDIAQHLLGGDVVALIGDLGGGKTIFAKGIADYFGIKEGVQSPTFNIIKEYEIDKFDIKKLYHMDFYRIKSDKELIELGLRDIFSDKSSVSVVEWANKGKKFLPKNTKFIKLDFVDEKTRKIIIK